MEEEIKIINYQGEQKILLNEYQCYLLSKLFNYQPNMEDWQYEELEKIMEKIENFIWINKTFSPN